MTQPTVCAVMLVNGRDAMVRRAVRSFEAQTYENRVLLIWNTGPRIAAPGWAMHPNRVLWCNPTERNTPTIGLLRNEANAATYFTDIILHMDSDDWSHPRRIEEQVALLQSSGKQCVGYRQVMFWDTRQGQFCRSLQFTSPFSNYAVGASMCYWRSAWEKWPFHEQEQAEDHYWWLNHKSQCAAESAIKDDGPRLICGIHGENKSTAYSGKDFEEALKQGVYWRRTPEYDDACRKAMELDG